MTFIDLVNKKRVEYFSPWPRMNHLKIYLLKEHMKKQDWDLASLCFATSKNFMVAVRLIL
jgi:hypothetical protein